MSCLYFKGRPGLFITQEHLKKILKLKRIGYQKVIDSHIFIKFETLCQGWEHGFLV